jgi:hypothetical protein
MDGNSVCCPEIKSTPITVYGRGPTTPERKLVSVWAIGLTDARRSNGNCVQLSGLVLAASWFDWVRARRIGSTSQCGGDGIQRPDEIRSTAGGAKRDTNSARRNPINGEWFGGDDRKTSALNMRRECGAGPVARQPDPDVVAVGMCIIGMSREHAGSQLLSCCRFGPDGTEDRIGAAVLQPARDKRDG